MHDLKTIERLNAAAFGDMIHNARAKGLYVVVIKEGAAIYTFASFSDAVAAEHRREAEERVHRNTGRTVKVYPPLYISGPKRIEEIDPA